MPDEPNLGDIPLFSKLPPPRLKDLKEHSSFQVHEPGAVFARQGEFTGDFYVVLSGGVGAYRAESAGPVQLLETLRPGDWFGEVSALSHQPSLATLKAETTCVVLAVPPATFKLLHQTPDFRTKVDERYRERSLTAHLRIAPLFRGLTDAQLRELRNEVRFEAHPADAKLAENGAEAGALTLVRSGAVKRVRRSPEGREEILGYYMTNSSFGEHALLSGNNRWDGDHVTMTPTDVLVVPVEVLRRVFANDPGAMQELQKKAEDILADERGEAELQQMVQRGSVKGGQALVIDLERCVRCNACVESCVAVHEDGVPRLSKKGSRFSFEQEGGTHHRYNLATSCYNCEIPGCMLSCSFGAIRRDAQGLIRFDYDNCVGCAMCVSACPYDVIRLAPKPGQGSFMEHKGILEQIPLLGRLFKKKSQDEIVPVENGPAVTNANGIPVQAKAIKCDLCAGLPFESCVYNCPTTAISRMSPRELFEKREVDSQGTFSAGN